MCELCQNPLHFSAEDNDSSTLGLPIIGPVQNAPVELSLAQIITQLQTQWGGSEEGIVHSWVPTTLTYSLPDQYPTSFGDVPSEASGLVIMSAVQKDAARLSFELWDDLIATSLTESVGDRNANITFNYSSATGGGTYAASSYFLTTPVREMAAVQIWANSGWSSHDQDADMFLGGYGLQTYLHEIGHALGLSHAGTYDAGNGSPISYANNAEYTLDNRKYTIMSYFGYYNTTTNVWQQDGSPGSGRYSSTPMLHDVAAIQAKYGADMSTRAGDTVYGFNSTAGRDVFNFNINTNPIITIWDGGGLDTLDVSGFSQAQRIDLNAGTYSDIGAYRQNVAIAFGATIENATGGSGNDTITGNAAANTLIGGAGFDRMYGGEGNDIIWADAADTTLDGGAGGDYLIYADTADHTFAAGAAGFETIVGNSGVDTIDATGATTFMVLWGNDGADRITLGEGNGYIYGGSGNDTLYGGSGINTLIGDGGADTLIGGGSIDVLWVDGQDTINGGGGLADWAIILSQAGDSINVANVGIEVAAGGAGNDTIIATGSATGITFWGAAGNDHLWGGNGNDNFYGGAGADTFHASMARNLDQIWDWQDGLDRIALSDVTSIAQVSISNSGTTAIIAHASGYQLFVHNAAGLIGAADFIFG